jgi:prophage regulatory protein
MQKQKKAAPFYQTINKPATPAPSPIADTVEMVNANKAGQPPPPPRLMYRAELCKAVGLSYPTIWLWMRDGRFPAGLDLGGKTAWLESEVNEWIAKRPRGRYKTPDEATR